MLISKSRSIGFCIISCLVNPAKTSQNALVIFNAASRQLNMIKDLVSLNASPNKSRETLVRRAKSNLIVEGTLCVVERARIFWVTAKPQFNVHHLKIF